MIRYELDPRLLVHKDGPVRGPHLVKVSTFDDEGVASFVEQLQEAMDADQRFVPVLIDSDGGSLDALFRMYDQLDLARRQGMTVATIVVGRACSAAADLLASGDRGCRFVAPRARVMVHCGHEEVSTRHVLDVRAGADELIRQTKLSFDIFDDNCSKPRGHFQKLLREMDQVDWWLAPEQAVEHGIADFVGIPEIAVKVDVKIELEVPVIEKTAPCTRPAVKRKRR